MTDRDPLADALEGVLRDPEARPATKVQAAAELRALRSAETPPDPAAVKLLTPDEVSLLAGALHWMPDFPELLSEAQREVVLRVGAATPETFIDADEAFRAMQARASAGRDEVTARRRGKRGGTGP